MKKWNRCVKTIHLYLLYAVVIIQIFYSQTIDISKLLVYNIKYSSKNYNRLLKRGDTMKYIVNGKEFDDYDEAMKYEHSIVEKSNESKIKEINKKMDDLKKKYKEKVSELNKIKEELVELLEEKNKLNPVSDDDYLRTFASVLYNLITN